MKLTSLLPLPNPLMTGPDSRIGNGGSGPLSGPATGSRGLSGLILISLSDPLCGLIRFGLDLTGLVKNGERVCIIIL